MAPSPQPVKSQALTDRVLAILSEDSLTKIHFQLNGLIVTGMRYSVVRGALTTGKITCSVIASSHLQNPSTSATGTSPSNTITKAAFIPAKGTLQNWPPNQIVCPSEGYGDNSFERAMIVHEATHAIWAVFRPRSQILAVDDECASFLAQAMYSRLGRGSMNASEIGGVEESAYKLADDIIEKNKDGRTSTVSSDELRPLRNAVAKRYLFVKSGDSDRSNELSVYDGI